MNASGLLQRRHFFAVIVTAGVLIVSVGLGLVWSSQQTGSQKATAKTQVRAAGALNVSTHNPAIRVNLTPDGEQELTLSIDGPYRVFAAGTNRVLAHGEQLKSAKVSATNVSIQIGTTELRINQVEIVPAQSPSIWVGTHQYRGLVRLIRLPGKKLLAVNYVPLEDYLASVVNSEMPASFARSAREAQAIIARTYVLSKMTGHAQFDVYSTTRSQKYNGYQYLDDGGKRLAGESTSSREVVQATAGIVCTHQGKLFTAYYSAVCGGDTVRGDSVFEDAVPLMKSVKCDWCREAKLYRWQNSLDRTRAEQAIRDHLRSKGQTFGTLKSLTPVMRKDGGLPYYRVSDGRQQHEIAGTTLRVTLPYGTLLSPHFTAEIVGTEIRFTGRGHGHTVGVCQWGANGLGKAGQSATQILQHYYPGVVLVRLRDTSALGQ